MNITKLADDQGLTCEEFLDIVAVFIDASKHDMTRLRSALERQDAEAVAQAAHSLKGAAGNLGLDAIYNLALEAEGYARSRSLSHMDQCVERLEAQLQQLIYSTRNAN